MIFLTEADFLTVITQDHLDEVVDGDSTLLDGAELTAIGEMTGYINIRYDPVASIDANDRIPIVVAMLVDMALYHAHARIMPDNIPTLREKRYTNAITWCEKVASGFIAPDLPIKTVTPSESTPLRYGSSGEKQDMYF
jgi:phage gp36-like protein